MPRGVDKIFVVKTFLTSLAKPCGTTKKAEKITKATREYFHHAAKLSLRFYELVKFINTQLSAEINRTQGVLSKMQLFMFGKAVEVKVSKATLAQLKRELKHFEICVRVFEEQCIKAVRDTQQAVLERNIDHLCLE